MEHLAQSNRVAVAAARDAAARARSLAEGLEALARALDSVAVELPTKGLPPVLASQPTASDDGLWTAADAAKFLKASKSWIYMASRDGRLPCIHVGALLRFDPRQVRALAQPVSAPAGKAWPRR